MISCIWCLLPPLGSLEEIQNLNLSFGHWKEENKHAENHGNENEQGSRQGATGQLALPLSSVFFLKFLQVFNSAKVKNALTLFHRVEAFTGHSSNARS